MDNIAVRINDLHKSFGDQVVLDGIDLEIETGKITVIIGKSGGGKSVLLKHIIGLLKPDAGEVWVDGTEITALNERGLNEVQEEVRYAFPGGGAF